MLRLSVLLNDLPAIKAVEGGTTYDMNPASCEVVVYWRDGNESHGTMTCDEYKQLRDVLRDNGSGD